MTLSSLPVEGKYTMIKVLIYLASSLPSLTIKDHEISSTHYNQNAISRKKGTLFTILHQLIKILSLSQTHSSEKERKKKPMLCLSQPLKKMEWFLKNPLPG